MTATEGRDTKGRILDAAERLFAEQGFAATSLRDVTAAAGVNLAAVNYHFGSKAALLEAVVRRALGDVNADRRCRLDALEGAGRQPAVEELLDAFVSPAYALFARHGARGRPLARLVGRAMGEPGEEIRRVVIAVTGEIEERYLRAFALALPHLPADELWWRFRSAIGVLVSHLSGLLADPGAAEGDSAEPACAWTITFLAAALRAPATARPGAGRLGERRA